MKIDNEEIVVLSESLQLEIKRIILDDLKTNKTEEETKAKIKKLIYKGAAFLSDINLKNLFVLTLARSFVNWYRYTATALIGIRTAVSSVSGIPPSKINLPPTIADNRPIIGFNIPNRPFITSAEQGVPLVQDYYSKQKRYYESIVKNLSRSQALVQKGVSLRNISEMAVRANANAQDLNNLKMRGVRLVWCTSHANCSKRCEPFQGKLYSLDGTYGVADGIRYEPLENATDIYYTTKAGYTYKNGLLGFGCRHRLVTYVQGSQAPFEFSALKIKKAREINNIQRKMEREIRNTKAEAFLMRKAGNLKEMSETFKEAREMTAEYEKFCEQNHVTAYIYRTRVYMEQINNNLVH